MLILYGRRNYYCFVTQISGMKTKLQNNNLQLVYEALKTGY